MTKENQSSRRDFFKSGGRVLALASLAFGSLLDSRVLGFCNTNIPETNIELNEDYLEALENCSKCLNNREVRCPYWVDGIVGKCSYFELSKLKNYKKNYP